MITKSEHPSGKPMVIFCCKLMRASVVRDQNVKLNEVEGKYYYEPILVRGSNQWALKLIHCPYCGTRLTPKEE